MYKPWLTYSTQIIDFSAVGLNVKNLNSSMSMKNYVHCTQTYFIEQLGFQPTDKGKFA